MDMYAYFQRRWWVFAPLFALPLGLMIALMPALKPPAIDALNGEYRNPCCLPIVLHDGVITAAGQYTGYTVENGKYGFDMIILDGIQIRDNNVIFGGTITTVRFYYHQNSVDEAGVMHLIAIDNARSRELLFKKTQ